MAFLEDVNQSNHLKSNKVSLKSPIPFVGRLGQVLRDGLIILALFCALTLLAEGGLRLFLPFPLSTLGTYQRFADVLYFHKPNSHGYETSPVNEFAPTLVRYNRLGFRGAWDQVPPGKPVVAVIGDSFVEARQVKEEQSVVGLLGEGQKDTFFINAGCSAYTTTHYLLLLRNRILPLRPARLFVFITFNDYQDNFVYEGGFYRHPELLGASPPTEKFQTATVDKDWNGFLTLHSALFTYVRKWALPPAKLAAPASPSVDRTFKNDFNQVNAPTEKMTAVEKGVLDFTHAGLAKINELSKVHGIEPYFFVIPLPQQVNEFEWRQGKVQFSGASADLKTSDRVYQDRLLSFCHSIGANCVDLLPEFQKNSKEGRPLFLSYDGHWNEAGNAVVADFILKGEFLKKPSR